jgi:rhodanese-related sulfurtransferase
VKGIPTSKKLLCPVCGNHHGCKIQEDKWVLCLRGTDKEDAPLGYRFIKPLRNLMGGLFVADKSARPDFSWQDRIDRINQRRAQEREAAARLLGIEERNRSYRAVVPQLERSQEHVQVLLERGLTSAEIEQVGFRSWEPGRRVTGATSQLAGIDSRGNRLVGAGGIFIPAYDPQGNITGAQIKTDSGRPGKYIWLSSHKEDGTGGSGPHLPNGELPLFVWKHLHSLQTSLVILCEGALKSAIAALLLWRLGLTDIAVIGTASSGFFGSETLKSYLKQLSPQRVQLAPDAGAVNNSSNIPAANRQTIKQCQAWGYPVDVLWWGQTHKRQHLDIDELLVAGRWGEVQTISPDKFFRLHPVATREKLENHTPQRAGLQRFDFPVANPHSKRSERTLSADEWYWRFGLPNWFRDKLTKLPQVFKGFGKPPALKTTTRKIPVKVISYTPGEHVPTREEYERVGSPTIRFAREHRLQLYAELAAAGWQHILDKSGTGSGKSHDVGLARPEQFGVSKLLYFAEDHRNPTVATIEANFSDLPVRHDGRKRGLVEDPTRKTALGHPHQRWAQSGEKPTVAGNCPHTELFHTLANKGYVEAAITAELNPICGNCKHNWSCGSEDKALPGSNYRAVRAEALKESPCIRLSLESTPDIGREVAAFWEEATRQIKPTQVVEARLADFDKMFADLEIEMFEVYDLLARLRRQIRPILTGKVKPTQETYRGWNDSTLRQLLGTPPEDLELIIDALKMVQPDLEEVLSVDGVLVANNSNVDSAAVKRLNKLVRQESYRDSKQQLESLPANWLLPLLRVWGGLEPGALRINGGVLTITTRNPRPAEIAQGLKFNVYLDATANHEFLARFLDINAADIVQVEQEPARFDNLKIVQITGLGLAGRERSDSLKQRVAALKAELRTRHANINFIDHKVHTEDGDGWWFVHNRGSNEYQTCDALASIGSPFQNIGALQDIYITLTGDRDVDKDAPGFSSFVQWLTQSEFIQAANRLRANRRSEQELPYYAATEIDLEFLQEYYPGCKIEQVDAFDITASAGSATQQSHWKIQQAILAAVEQTGKAIENLTQVEAAKFAQVTQGRIAQVASKYGGWKVFLKLLASLLESIYRTTNNSPEDKPTLDEEQEFIARTYLPLTAVEDPPDMVEALLVTVQSHGWRMFEAILEAVDPVTKGRLLAKMMAGLPDALRKEFRATVVVAGG